MIVKSHIYETRLKSNELRVECLTAELSKDYAMYIDLKTYEDDGRSGSEIVFYMRGGEEGDSTTCRLILIAPYWDVLPQSYNFVHARNTYDMGRRSMYVPFTSKITHQRNVSIRSVDFECGLHEGHNPDVSVKENCQNIQEQ